MAATVAMKSDFCDRPHLTPEKVVAEQVQLRADGAVVQIYPFAFGASR